MNSNFGQGGKTNTLPSRTYPQIQGRDENEFQGGARGPAALPSRILFSPPAAPPNLTGGQRGILGTLATVFSRALAVKDPPGLAGPVSIEARTGREATQVRRSAPWVGPKYSPGNQAHGQADNTYDHDTIGWSRPYYPNAAGLATFRAPVPLPSWSANTATAPTRPTVPIPISHKRIDSFTINEEYGSTRQLFPLYGQRRPDSGITQMLKNRATQAKTSNPWNVLLTRFGLAGSFGSQTPTLATAPVTATPGGGTGAVASPYGSY
jgi:hypothetical protein